jgi:hypothetical protein
MTDIEYEDTDDKWTLAESDDECGIHYVISPTKAEIEVSEAGI